MSAKVLVTGAAGFIGSHICRECLRQNYEVVGLDDLSGGFVENLPKGMRFIKGSITDRELLDSLFEEESFDYVFHLAAYAAEGLSHFIRRFVYETNLCGSVCVINAAVSHEVKCLVFTSSIAVYGCSNAPVTEDMTPCPVDPYGISKYAVELDLRTAREMFGLNYVIFRPHNVYGELQSLSDKYRNVIGIFMSQLRRGEPMTVFGDGSQTRAFSYVGDLVGPMVESITRPECYGEVFNIGSGHVSSVLELAHSVAAAMGVEPRVVHLPARHEVQHIFADHDKLRRFFGEESATPLTPGLARMAAWAKRAECPPPAASRELELTKNVPPVWR
jgi:UDP-glucose 4-epimerase